MHRFVRAAVATALGLTGGASVIAPALAQEAASTSEQEAGIDTVVVLGTARADKTELTSTAPVDVITPEQLRETGAVTINQALSRLHPSFNFPQGQNAVKGQGVRAASLRGVGPAYTLVLVNGKRRHVSAQLSGTDPWPAAQVVDINTIPFSSVERIEVLRDGAAAQYGSDAIAGVINIVLKRRFEGRQRRRALRRLRRWRRPARIRSPARRASSSARPASSTSTSTASTTSNVDRSEADWRQLFPTGDPRNTPFDAKYGQWGQSSRDNWVGLINAEREITSKLTAYGWANYADKSADNYVNPERIVKANTQKPDGHDAESRVGNRGASAFIPTAISRGCATPRKTARRSSACKFKGDNDRLARFLGLIRPERNGALDVQHRSTRATARTVRRASISARGRATRPAPRWIT